MPRRSSTVVGVSGMATVLGRVGKLPLYIHEAGEVFLDLQLFSLLGFHLFCEAPLEVLPVEVVERCNIGLRIIGRLVLVGVFRGLVGGLWLMLGVHRR